MSSPNLHVARRWPTFFDLTWNSVPHSEEIRNNTQVSAFQTVFIQLQNLFGCARSTKALFADEDKEDDKLRVMNACLYGLNNRSQVKLSTEATRSH
ncbi:hypothetical protein N7528_009062 [Penicillium herquei]|nr:hypothetical protein N7528_009062 [Penicillium herquei]